MPLTLAALLSTVLLVSGVTPAAAQQAPCTFILGFAALHSAIPDVVGDCVSDQTTNPVNGDAQQSTTNGLLVWRKADNLTAFTDGSQTWINGPFGIQSRLNSQRFFWEPNPDGLPVIPTPMSGDRCHTAGLALSVVGSDAGAGNIVGTFSFTNQLAVGCAFFGFPGAQMLDAEGNPLPTNVIRDGSLFTNDPPPSTVNVPPHGAAQFRIHWEQVPVGNETTCPVSSSLQVTPPDEFFPLTVQIAIRACGGGRLDMGAVQPAPAAG